MHTGRERQAVNRSQIAFGARSCSINRRRIAQQHRELLPCSLRSYGIERILQNVTHGDTAGPAYESTVDVYPPVHGSSQVCPSSCRGSERTFSSPTLPYGPSRLLQMQLKTPRDRSYRTDPAARGLYNVAMILRPRCMHDLHVDSCLQRSLRVIKWTMDIIFEQPMIP